MSTAITGDNVVKRPPLGKPAEVSRGGSGRSLRVIDLCPPESRETYIAVAARDPGRPPEIDHIDFVAIVGKWRCTRYFCW
ncbi:hypothetical protein GCM10009677_58610 [Sphaerisporangium rubeum]